MYEQYDKNRMGDRSTSNEHKSKKNIMAIIVHKVAKPNQ